MNLSPQLDSGDPAYPELRRHHLDKRCKRRKIVIAAATLAVLGGAGAGAAVCIDELRREYIVPGGIMRLAGEPMPPTPPPPPSPEATP